MDSFSHIDEGGGVKMVDVGAKKSTYRVAVVEAFVDMAPRTLAMLKEKALPKGDVLTTAKIAGIMAAKQTSSLIPMCHPLPLSDVDIAFSVTDVPPCVRIEARAAATAQTGVEMEALVAAQIAASTIYDMCKAVQKDMVIRGVRLLSKSGGKSGDYRAPAQEEAIQC